MHRNNIQKIEIGVAVYMDNDIYLCNTHCWLKMSEYRI